ncbi:hypothetical protein V5799_010028 [Amblyomma americanum]|uniref:Uncharacterized protein n=1 Tax=Amblyomma americanum TaxID=6943 RepID=A0AAQ4F8T1_AMBAM
MANVFLFSYLRIDAEEDENTRLEILRVLEKQTEGLGALTEQQLVVLDYIMVALFSSAAAGWHGGGVDRAAPSSTPPCVDWRALCPHMHWGPLVIQGSVSCIARAMQALKIQCNPLYFAIPVTVASSTTLILPTAAMPIAILDDVVTLSRRKLLIHGTLVKVVTLTSLILSMNTLGEALFSWSELPSWALQLQSVPNASSVAEPPPNGRLVHSLRRG